MAGPDSIPDLLQVITKPDGTLYHRIEAEQQIRSLVPKIYHRRIHAKKVLGLPQAQAFDMKEIVLLHWMLDELIRRGQVLGDQVGVNTQSYEDENEQRQFVQRLSAMIQAGQAFTPKAGEGVDMSNIPGTPPGPPNGQQGFMPPPLPPGMGAPQGFVPPQGPPQGFVPPQGPPQGFVPQGPPQTQQQYAPAQPPQQGFVPQGPPQIVQPGYVPQAGPMMPPGYAPQGPPTAPPQGPPQAQAPQGPPAGQAAAPATRRRGKAAGEAQAAQPAPQAAPVPQMPAQQFQLPQQQFQLPQQAAAPAPVAAPAQAVDLGPVIQLVQQLQQQVAMLTHKLNTNNVALAILSRAVYQKPGAADLDGWLKELGISVPQ